MWLLRFEKYPDFPTSLTLIGFYGILLNRQSSTCGTCKISCKLNQFTEFFPIIDSDMCLKILRKVVHSTGLPCKPVPCWVIFGVRLKFPAYWFNTENSCLIDVSLCRVGTCFPYWLESQVWLWIFGLHMPFKIWMFSEDIFMLHIITEFQSTMSSCLLMKNKYN